MDQVPSVNPRKIDDRIQRHLAEGHYGLDDTLPDKLVVCPKCGANTRTGVEILNKRASSGERWKYCKHCKIKFVQNIKKGWCKFLNKEINPEDCLKNTCGKFPGMPYIQRLAASGISYQCAAFMTPKERMEALGKIEEDAKTDVED